MAKQKQKNDPSQQTGVKKGQNLKGGLNKNNQRNNFSGRDR